MARPRRGRRIRPEPNADSDGPGGTARDSDDRRRAAGLLATPCRRTGRVGCAALQLRFRVRKAAANVNTPRPPPAAGTLPGRVRTDGGGGGGGGAPRGSCRRAPFRHPSKLHYIQFRRATGFDGRNGIFGTPRKVPTVAEVNVLHYIHFIMCVIEREGGCAPRSGRRPGTRMGIAAPCRPPEGNRDIFSRRRRRRRRRRRPAVP